MFKNYHKTTVVVIVVLFALLAKAAEAAEGYENNAYNRIQAELLAVVPGRGIVDIQANLEAAKQLLVEAKGKLLKSSSKRNRFKSFFGDSSVELKESLEDYIKHLEKIVALSRCNNNCECSVENRNIIIPLLMDREFYEASMYDKTSLRLNIMFTEFRDLYMENCRKLHMQLMDEQIKTVDMENLELINKTLAPFMARMIDQRTGRQHSRLIENPAIIWNAFIGTPWSEYHWKESYRQELMDSYPNLPFELRRSMAVYKGKPEGMPSSLIDDVFDNYLKPACKKYNDHFVPKVFKPAAELGVIPESHGIPEPNNDSYEIQFYRLWAFSKVCENIINNYLKNGEYPDIYTPEKNKVPSIKYTKANYVVRFVLKEFSDTDYSTVMAGYMPKGIHPGSGYALKTD